MSDGYIEVQVTLDSHNLLQIETLIEARIKELRELKKANADAWFISAMADEQLSNYRALMRKIKEAREDVKRVKAAHDTAYLASLRKPRSRAKS
jgi:predicted phage-related endonuclease